MTALAMIIGMVPMALGLGEGGEQNAPLGRAVIGGLMFATVATLFFVPTVFTAVASRPEARWRNKRRSGAARLALALADRCCVLADRGRRDLGHSMPGSRPRPP